MVKYYYSRYKIYIEFSMGNKVQLSMKHLNVTGDRKLIPHFVGLFSMVQWFGPLAYQLNLETRYR